MLEPVTPHRCLSVQSYIQSIFIYMYLENAGCFAHFLCLERILFQFQGMVKKRRADSQIDKQANRKIDNRPSRQMDNQANKQIDNQHIVKQA